MLMLEVVEIQVLMMVSKIELILLNKLWLHRYKLLLHDELNILNFLLSDSFVILTL